MGWDGEVLYFGCRAQILFCGGVGGGMGRYYISDVEPKFCFVVGWGGMGRYYISDVEPKFCFVVGWGGLHCIPCIKFHLIYFSGEVDMNIKGQRYGYLE